jgi:hypothetical protein
LQDRNLERPLTAAGNEQRYEKHKKYPNPPARRSHTVHNCCVGAVRSNNVAVRRNRAHHDKASTAVLAADRALTT